MKIKEKIIQIRPSKKKGESSASIIFEKELTIFSLEGIKDKIIDTVAKYDHIEFVFKAINNMDLSFVQLIYSIKQTAKTQNKKITFNMDLPGDIKLLFNNSDLIKVLI